MNLTNHQPVPAGRRRSRTCDGADVPNNDYWNLNGGPSVQPGLRDTPPLTEPDVWYSYRRQPRGQPAGDAVLRPYGPNAPTPRRRRARRRRARGCSRSSTRAASGPHGIAKYQYDPANPNPMKFPPYYDDSVILGEFTQDTLRELKVDSQNRVFKINPFLPLRRGEHRELDVHVRVRQPDGHAVGRGRRLLPAHLRRRVLQHQPGRRDVQVAVRQGQARTGGRAHDRQDRRRRCR